MLVTLHGTIVVTRVRYSLTIMLIDISHYGYGTSSLQHTAAAPYVRGMRRVVVFLCADVYSLCC
jgi:hypothetical protein